MTTHSSKTHRSPFRRWCQIIPVALLSIPLLASAQTTPVLTITENPDVNQVGGFDIVWAGGVNLPFFGAGLISSALPQYGAHAHVSFAEINPAYLLFNGPPSGLIAWSNEPNPADGINIVQLISGPSAIPFLFLYSDVPADIQGGTLPTDWKSIATHFDSGDTGIAVTGGFLGGPAGHIFFYDNAASTPDPASTLCLSLMAIMALIGAVGLKLIPFALKSQA